MHVYGDSAARHADMPAMIIDDNPRDKEQSSEEPCSDKTQSPSLAGYIVYVITLLGFLTMCVSVALR